MSQGDVEAIREGYEAWNRRDVKAVLETLAAEIEFTLLEGGVNVGRRSSRESVIAIMTTQKGPRAA
jgi:hypothetical protein